MSENTLLEYYQQKAYIAAETMFNLVRKLSLKSTLATAEEIHSDACLDVHMHNLFEEMRERQLIWKYGGYLPRKGQYFTMYSGGGDLPATDNSHLGYIQKVVDRSAEREKRQSKWRSHSYIEVAIVQVNGEKARYTADLGFGQWMEKWRDGQIKPAHWILTKEFPVEEVELIAPLVPFIQIPEGRHLSIAMLRKLLKATKNGAR